MTPARADPGPSWLSHRLVISALALLALFQGLGGLYRLPDYRQQHEAALATELWVTAFAPPPWLILLLIAALAGLSLVLAWRVAGNVHARWLALFSALLANGYGVMATATSSPLFDGYLSTALPALRSWGVAREVLRAIGHAVAGLERLLWLAAWPLAATVSVWFVRGVLGIGAATRAVGAASALLVSWSFVLVAGGLPRTPVVLVTGVLLAWLAFVAWWRGLRGDDDLPAWVMAQGLAVAVALSALPRYPVIPTHAVAALSVLPAVLRVADVRPALLLVFPLLLALSVALHAGNDHLTPSLMILWVGLCLLVVLRTIVAAAGSLAERERRQALWFLSGWVGAGLGVVTWQVAVWGGRLAACTVTSVSVPCWLYRHQDWFLIAPLPILLLAFVAGLLYRGPIDAARLFRRTVVYGSMLMLTLFVLGVTEALLGDLVRRGLPWEMPPLVGTGVMAIVLYPAKRACDKGAERLLARILRWTERDAPADGPA